MKTNNLFLRIVLGVGVILLAVISALAILPPRAVAADAPSNQFSAGRAMNDLQVVANEPHEAGSEAQARVRSYIVEQVDAIGLNAELETSGKITNILVHLPGTDSTGTVLVSGHYDSHPPAPGAGDDGISTVAMLESLRVLRAGSPLRNDVLFLFTDGEELGWLGAGTYLLAHPEAQDEIDMMLVFDARPGNAPLTLMETSPGDAWMIRQMAGISLPLWAGSWNNTEERQEQDTDFEIFQAGGLRGVVFENEANGTRYHTTRDTVSAISPNLVQAFGHTIIALTNRFGSVDLRTYSKGPDSIFFTLPLIGIVAYPGWMMPVLSGLGLVALLVFVVLAWRQKRFSPGRFGLSLLGLLLGIVVIVLLAQLSWGVIKDNYAAGSAGNIGFESRSTWMAGLMLGATVLMIVLLAFLSRRFGGINLLPAAVVIYLLVWFAVHFLMDADNPLTTASIAWPMLGGIAGMGVLLFTKNPVLKTTLLMISALMILVLAVPTLFMASFTREDAWIPVLATAIPLGLLAPQVGAIFGRSSKNDSMA